MLNLEKWVKERFNEGYSRDYIEQKLLEVGYDKDIVDNVLSNFFEPNEEESVSEDNVKETKIEKETNENIVDSKKKKEHTVEDKDFEKTIFEDRSTEQEQENENILEKVNFRILLPVGVLIIGLVIFFILGFSEIFMLGYERDSDVPEIECGRDLECFTDAILNDCQSATYIELAEDFQDLQDGVEKRIEIIGSENGRCKIDYNITDLDSNHPWHEMLSVGDGRRCYYEPDVLIDRVSIPVINFNYTRDNCEGEIIP